jgi:acylphosphatase
MSGIRVHVWVSGHVQGVLFRSTTQEKAQELGVRGWVRNLPDGQVEAVFEGDRDPVQEMIGFCHQGPRYARVRNVEVRMEEPTGEFETFQIRYD